MAIKDKLSSVAVETAKPHQKPYKLSDGGGLYLLVNPDGSRWWRLKYRVDGREKLLALGVYPAKSLKAARKAREDAKEQLAAGTDPSEQRKANKANRIAARGNTFKAVAMEWFASRSGKWAKSHSDKILGRLENHVFPEIGSDPVSGLGGPRLLQVLRKVQETGSVDTAHRVRQYMNAIFRYAIQTHRLQANPTPHSEVLPPLNGGKFASITDPKGVGALLRAIRGYRGAPSTRTALKLAPLVFVRPGELRAAEWLEFDLDAAEWAIPEGRMKKRRKHIVPLSKQAVAILRELHRFTGSGRYVFPSERGPLRPMSENTLNTALRAMGYSKDQMTAHGFRHMASTLLHESRKWRSEVIERQMAHADHNAIRAVYNAAEYLPERVEMMQWWANRLDTLAAVDNVLSMKAAKKR
jgi:integrase